MSIFTYIKSALVSALRNDTTEGIVQFKGKYPQQVVYWFCKNGVFKVKGLSKEYVNGNVVYNLNFSQIDRYTHVLKDDYESLEKKGLIGEYKDESITNKFNKIYDKYRYELECPNWSNEPDETGYKACPYNELGYEKLDKADSCSFEAYICCELGYTDYQEFTESMTNEERKVIEEAYENEAENIKAPEYTYI